MTTELVTVLSSSPGSEKSVISQTISIWLTSKQLFGKTMERMWRNGDRMRTKRKSRSRQRGQKNVKRAKYLHKLRNVAGVGSNREMKYISINY